MPAGEIWIEDPSANLVNNEEQAEAKKMFDEVNTEITKEISSAKFSIVGTEKAFYEVTYKDGSKSGKIQAQNLAIKQVTEFSAATNADKIVVTSTKITGKLVPQKKLEDGTFVPDKNGKIAEGTKVIAILNPSANNNQNYCTGKCSTDKASSQIGEATVNTDGTFEINVPNGFDYKQEVGLTVKEPHKFKACNAITVEYVIPNVPVRNPKKLTPEEKEAIKKAIKEANKEANTLNGTSKLPDGTGANSAIGTIIEVADDGNVKIIGGNDVDVKWENGSPIVQKNDDGTVKVKEDKEGNVTPFKNENVLVNKAPDAPTITTDVDKGEITITPNPLDTDAKTIEVKYTDPKGVSKTATATKGDNGEWTVPDESDISVDKTSGVVTITFDKIKNKTNVDAKVTDEGFNVCR